ISLGILFIYQYTVQSGGNEEKTRAMVFTTLILANILLSLVNRSFYYSLFNSFSNKNSLFPIIIGLTLALLVAILYVAPLAGFFDVTSLNFGEWGAAFLVAAVSILWFEVFKWMR